MAVVVIIPTSFKEIEVTPKAFDCRTVANYTSFLSGLEAMRNAFLQAKKEKVIFPEMILTPSEKYRFSEILEYAPSNLEIVTFCPIILTSLKAPFYVVKNNKLLLQHVKEEPLSIDEAFLAVL